uniref:Ulp1 protease family, C-terminal catalytic domain-containing protein n=1 Tax=Tanacetum cinerariifolium TaxID=118510 RepID=A0A6L2JSW9_TANCI|nr:ulp1 protease family, C-terminal catalytic domain-containing protein [Tanacetum cinerariifolium]
MEKPQKKRGINKVKDLPVGESVRFNKHGVSIGKYQRTFTSYCGNTVRMNIFILYPHWHKIEDEEKDLLWFDIKKIREEVRAREMKQTNRPRVRPKGFAGFEEQWEKELNDTNKATDLHKIPGRGSNFCLGRRCLDKDRNLSVPPEIAEIAKNCVRPTTSNIRIDCIKETTTCSLFSPESILTRERILCVHALIYLVGDSLIHGKMLQKGLMRVSVLKVLNWKEGLELPVPDEDIPNLGSMLSAFIQWIIGAIAHFSGLLNTLATSVAAKSTLPKVQGPAECLALMTVPTITQESKKRKKTTKTPVEQSKVEKENSSIRKQLHLLRKDINDRLEAMKKGYYQYIIELLTGKKLATNILTLFSRLEEEKAHRYGQVYNWKTTTYGNIRNDEDIRDLRSIETKFPAIVYNDAFTSEVTFSCELMVSLFNDNQIDIRISFNESDNEDYTKIYDKNSFSYKIFFVDDLKTYLENDNDKVNMPSFSSPKPTISYFNDLDFFKYFENEFPAIVYNDALTSKSEFLTEPTISPQQIDEFNLKDKTSLSECDEEEENILYFNDLFPFNAIYPNEL